MGKQIYLSKFEAEWLVNLVEYHDCFVDEKAQEAIRNLREKAESVLRKEKSHERAGCGESDPNCAIERS